MFPTCTQGAASSPWQSRTPRLICLQRIASIPPCSHDFGKESSVLSTFHMPRSVLNALHRLLYVIATEILQDVNSTKAQSQC